MKELAYNLRRLRKLKDETQLSLAQKIGVTKTSIANIEQEINGASLAVIQAIAKALNIKVKDLFEDIPDEAQK